MRFLSFIAFAFMIIGCGDKREVVIQKYEDGQKKVTYVILRGSQEKPLDFEYKAYYNNGVLMKEGLMQNVIEEGEWKYYFYNGELSSTGNYYNGVRHGKFVRYYEGGQIDQQGSYLNGEVSEVTFYNRNGTVKTEALDPFQYIKHSVSPWSGTQREKISSRCNNTLEFEYKNSRTFCKCMIDSVSKYVEFNALDTLSDYDKSLIYGVFMKTGACNGQFY